MIELICEAITKDVKLKRINKNFINKYVKKVPNKARDVCVVKDIIQGGCKLIFKTEFLCKQRS